MADEPRFPIIREVCPVCLRAVDSVTREVGQPTRYGPCNHTDHFARLKAGDVVARHPSDYWADEVAAAESRGRTAGYAEARTKIAAELRAACRCSTETDLTIVEVCEYERAARIAEASAPSTTTEEPT